MAMPLASLGHAALPHGGVAGHPSPTGSAAPPFSSHNSSVPPGSPCPTHSPHGAALADDFSDFSRAVRIALSEAACFVPTGQSAVVQGAWVLRQEAAQYLVRLKEHPGLWAFACSVLSRRPEHFVSVEVFWACGALVERVNAGHYLRLPDDGKAAFEATLMQWVRGTCPHVSKQQDMFVRSKFAQLMVKTLQHAYPARWVTFFDDLFATLHLGDAVVELWLRILHAIDEVIVDRDTQASRSAVARDRDTAIKDAMRETCVPRIVQTWYGILSSAHDRRPDLCRQCMTTLCPYIEWIDISLVSSVEWVNMLYHFLGRADLREAAVECLLTLSEKKIADPATKLDLLRRLRVTDAMPNVVAQLLAQHQQPLAAGSDDFAGADFLLRIGELVQGVGMELNDVVNSFVVQGSPALAAAALAMLDASLPMLWQLLGCGHAALSLQVCEHFTRKYVELLKRQPQLPRGQLEPLVSLVSARLQYHPRYNFDAPDDYEVTADALRKQLLIVFRNLCALHRDATCGFISQAIQAMLASLASAQWYQVEAVLRLFYTVGEELGAALSTVFKDPESPLSQVMGGLLGSGIATGPPPHPAVAVAYIECLQRYHHYFTQSTTVQERVPAMLRQLLGPAGAQHPSPRVRTKACGIFSYMAKSLKQQLMWCLDDICGCVQQLLSGADLLGEKERSALYETVGVLVHSLTDTDLPKALRSLEQLIAPPLAALQARLCEPATDAGGHATAALIACLAALSKGFSGIAAPAVGRAPGPVLAVWHQVTGVVAQAVPPYTGHAAVREKALLYMHRMIDLMGRGALPYVLPCVRSLLPAGDLTDLPKLVRILTQLLQRIKQEAVPTVDAVFSDILTRALDLTSVSWLDKPELMHTEQAREHLELLRALYMLFTQASQQDCIALFLTESSRPRLGTVLDTLARGCASHPEMEVAKTCYQVLARMAAAWIGSVDGFEAFVAQQVMPVTLHTVRQQWFSPGDAKCSAVLCELAALFHAIASRVGADAFAATFAQQWSVPPQTAAAVVAALQHADLNHKRARDELRAIVLRLNGGKTS